MNSQQRRHDRREYERIKAIVHEVLHPTAQEELPPEKLDTKVEDKKPVHPQKETGRAWRIAKRTSQITGTVIGYLAAILGIVTGYLALLQHVSVSQNEQLDPANAFSSPFIVSNDGPLPMENVRFRCGIVGVKHQFGGVVKGDAQFGSSFIFLPDKSGKLPPQNLGDQEMLPGERSTIPSCNYPFLDPIEKADIGIVVDFRVGYTPFSSQRIFRFGTLKDSAGKIHWFPFPVK